MGEVARRSRLLAPVITCVSENSIFETKCGKFERIAFGSRVALRGRWTKSHLCHAKMCSKRDIYGKVESQKCSDKAARRYSNGEKLYQQQIRWYNLRYQMITLCMHVNVPVDTTVLETMAKSVFIIHDVDYLVLQQKITSLLLHQKSVDFRIKTYLKNSIFSNETNFLKKRIRLLTRNFASVVRFLET